MEYPMESLEKFIRDVPDFPKKGIVFKDITPLLADATALGQAVNQLWPRLKARAWT